MKLFKVFVEKIEYDSYHAFVVVADSKEAAIKLVLLKSEDHLECQSMAPFFNNEIMVDEFSMDEPGCIIESFNEG